MMGQRVGGPSRQYKDKSPRASSAATLRQNPRQASKGTSTGREAHRTLNRNHAARRPGRAKSLEVKPGPGVVLPRHVRACVHSSHKSERWGVWTWQRNSPAVVQRVAYQCESWRCPVCARHEAAVTFARMKQATEREQYDPKGWVYLVLTIDREGYYSGVRWPNVTAAYRALSGMSNKLLKRLGREWGDELSVRVDKRGGIREERRIGSHWVAVVEAHRSGWPHVNLVLYAPRLARELADSTRARKILGCSDREAVLAEGTVLHHTTGAGWGRQSTFESARDTEALAGYLVKLAGNHEASMGELAKITQAPTMAPARFRRLRSGKGFLPPRYHNPDVTGVLVRRRRSPEGDWETLSVNEAKDPAQQALRSRVIGLELELIREEEDALSRGSVPAQPPVRQARVHSTGGVELESLRQASERRWAESVRAVTGEYDIGATTDWQGYGPPVSA